MSEIKFRFWTPDDRMLEDHEGWIEGIGINEALNCSSGYGYKIMQYTGLKDKNFKEMYVGDIVIGYRSRLSGDGYIRKGFPQKVRYIYEIVWSDGKHRKSGFQLEEIGVHPEDKFATDKYQYRSIDYRLQEERETFLKNNEYVWKGCAETLEVIGNRYSNPELLNTVK